MTSDAIDLDEPIAFVADRFVRFSQAVVPIWDLGFTQGVSVTERIRTCQRQPWLLPQHLERLLTGVQQANLPLNWTCSEISEIVHALVRHNFKFLDDLDELSIGLAVTGGDSLSQGPWGYSSRPSTLNSGLPSPNDAKVESRLVVHASRLPQEQWKDAQTRGLQLFISPVEEISGRSIPKSFKTRSRFHYWLAEQDPRFTNWRALPLLLDSKGNVAESPNGTVVMLHEGQLLVPESGQILEGVTLAAMIDCANQFNLPVVRKTISTSELLAAEEIWWLNASVMILPVVAVDQTSIGTGTPGGWYAQIARRMGSMK